MALKIYLLGQFKLEASDHVLDLRSRPSQSLLAYLALNAGMTHRREKLAGMLWPDSTESNARSYLRQALWRIRTALKSQGLGLEDLLRVSDISVTFDDQSNVWLDATQLTSLTDSASLEDMIAAVSLFKGELLPGFYDEWIVVERDRLQAAYHQKMSLLLHALLGQKKWDEAVRWSEAWIRYGHSPEAAYRALLTAFNGLGDQGMVTVSYQRCVDALDRELGVEPSTETEQLYQQIRQGEFSIVAQTAVPAKGAVIERRVFPGGFELLQTERPLFVAREQELAQLSKFLDSTLSGQGSMIFVTGEAGSGKTALVQEFTRRAQDSYADLLVAGGNCNAHTGIGDPYLPFREVLELLTGDVEARCAAGTISIEHAQRLWNLFPLTCRALVENGPDLVDTFIAGAALSSRIPVSMRAQTEYIAHLDGIIERKASAPAYQSSQQSDLFEQYNKVLQTLAQKAPLVVVIDDLQWADLGSINLLFHLARHLRGSHILIIGAFRSEEMAIGRDGKRHPLAPVISEIQRRFGDIIIDVDHAERQNFLDAIIDSEPNQLDESFRRMLFKQTRGHPLFTIELLRGLQERGDLVRDDRGNWIEGPTLDWDKIPARVEAVVAERINRLSPSLRATLRVASVEGELFTAELVARVQGADEYEMLQSLSGDLQRKHRLISAHSIVRKNGRLLSRYRFRHIQIQKYLYGSLDDVERVHIHEQVGTILEELYAETDEQGALAVQLARHFRKAHITEKAVHYLHRAGVRALQLSAAMEAITHLRKGLELLETLPETEARTRLELDMQLALGMSWMSTGTPDPEMEKAYARARDLCTQMGELTQLSNALGGLAILNYVRARPQKGLAFAEEALKLAYEAQDPLLIMLGHWYMSFLLFGTGHYSEAREHISQITAIYDPVQHHQSLIDLRGIDAAIGAVSYDACSLWCLGYVEQAMIRRQEAFNLIHKYGHAFTQADVLCYAGCMMSWQNRDFSSQKHYAGKLIRLAGEKGFPGWLKMGTCFRGEALGMEGEVEEGISLLQAGIEEKLAVGERINLAGRYGMLANIYCNSGQIAEAQNALDDGFTCLEEDGERHWEAELHRLQAELFLVQGDEAGAQKAFEKAIIVAREQRAKPWELRSTIGLTRLWLKQDKPDQARLILAKIYDQFTEGFDTPDLVEARLLLDGLAEGAGCD